MSLAYEMQEKNFWMSMTYILLKRMGNHVRISQEDIKSIPAKLIITKGRMENSDDIVLLYKEQ